MTPPPEVPDEELKRLRECEKVACAVREATTKTHTVQVDGIHEVRLTQDTIDQAFIAAAPPKKPGPWPFIVSRAYGGILTFWDDSVNMTPAGDKMGHTITWSKPDRARLLLALAEDFNVDLHIIEGALMGGSLEAAQVTPTLGGIRNVLASAGAKQ